MVRLRRRLSDFLEKLRWPEGFVCPRCKHAKAWRMIRGRKLVCTECELQTSVTAGTIFENPSRIAMVVQGISVGWKRPSPCNKTDHLTRPLRDRPACRAWFKQSK